MKLLFTLCAVLISQPIAATTIELNANKDNTLYESNLQALSNGAGIYFFAGRTAQDKNNLRRGLIHFDLSVIPPGSTINDVSLEITSSRTIAGARQISVHKALADWGESDSNATSMGGGIGAAAQIGDATWTNAFHEGAAWALAGGDYDPLAAAVTTMEGEVTGVFNSVELTTQVQDWHQNPSTNYGWVVRGDESETTTAFRFNTRENPNNPPKLIVDYSLPNLQFTPAKDNTLYEDLTGSVSNGAGTNLFFGKVSNGSIRRAALEFDLTLIPETATIVSVQLDLAVISIPGSAQKGTAALHLALNEWGEAGSAGGGMGAPAQTGDTTWIHTFYDTETWTSAGGDYKPIFSASSDFTDTTTDIVFASTAALRSDVTAWVRNSDNNHGWLLLGDEVNAGNPRSIDSRESTFPPLLTIEYYVLADLIFMDGFQP